MSLWLALPSEDDGAAQVNGSAAEEVTSQEFAEVVEFSRQQVGDAANFIFSLFQVNGVAVM